YNLGSGNLSMTRDVVTLDDLRRRLTELDRQLLALVGERKALSSEVARVKRATGYPTRDFEREREVIEGARATAQEVGVPPALAEELLRLLIRSSLTTQEQASVAARGAGSGRRVLVIGGGGKMGRWFVQFLSSQGFAVEVADPHSGPDGVPRVADWRTTDLKHDYIVLATPLGVTDAILRDLALRRPRAVIFDVGSLKSPLRAGLMALRSHGCRVTSIHPMFGPDTELLSGRHVIFVDLGNAEALAEARALFASTMAEQVVMSLDDHDRLIAYVLGLSHALNIAFFTALAESGAAPRPAVEHDLRRPARCRQPRGAGESRSLLRDPESERLRRGVAGGSVESGGAPAHGGALPESRRLCRHDAAGPRVSRGPAQRGGAARLGARARGKPVRVMAEDHLKALEEENERLRTRLRDLTEEVGRNDSLFRKTQER